MRTESYSLLALLTFLFCAMSGCGFDPAQTATTARSEAEPSSNVFPAEIAIARFLTKDLWIALDGHGTIWRTVNRGQTWISESLVRSESQRVAIDFVNERFGYFLIDEKVWVTYDGGEQWTKAVDFRVEIISEFENINSVFFLDEKVGWCVGNAVSSRSGVKGLILNTRDGGTTWSRQEIERPDLLARKSGANWDLRNIWFENSNLGWAAGRSAVLRTKNGGQSWSALENIPGTYVGFQFHTSEVGLLLEKDVRACVFTVSGGDHWEKVAVDSQVAPDARFLLHGRDELLLFHSNGVIQSRRLTMSQWTYVAVGSSKWDEILKKSFGVLHVGETLDGAVICMWVPRTPGLWPLVIISEDGGKTWS